MLDMKIIGENIRKERKKQLLTIEKLAEMAGISDNFLGKLERGDSMPSFATMDRIACALHVSIDALKGNGEGTSEYQFIQSLMEINGLSAESKEKFIDFISTNIRYFK